MVRLIHSKRFPASVACFLLAASLSSTASAQVPDAPTGVTALAGSGNISVAFAAPFNIGGSAITSFTATCGSQSSTGGASPIVVNNLASGAAVSCTVTAANASGSSAASTASNSATPVLLNAVVSRKIHGGAGGFDLPIDRSQSIGGLVTVEPRTIGNGHMIVFQFSGNIPLGWAATVSQGVATVASTTSEVVITLTNISDNQRLMVTLTNVAGAVSLPPVSMGFLVGDVNNSRTVNSSDVSTVKARAGQTTNTANFLYDINASGSINSSDISTIKARAGSVLVTGGAVAIISAAPLPVTAGLTYCHPFTASETIPPGGWTMSANAPVWVTLNAKRGVICGIPRSPADVGTTTFNVSATNGISAATQTVTLTVSVITLPPPVITSGAPASATTDLTYCHPFTASQPIPSGGWALSAGATPEWVTLNSKRGVICGIPRTADIGISTFTISASNANGTAPQFVTLTVSALPPPVPVISTVSPNSALAGATVTINGTGLSGVTSVKIGTATTAFTINLGGTSITTTVPAAATVGLGNVVLGTAANATAATASFVVQGPGSGEFTNDVPPVSVPALSKLPFDLPAGHAGANGAGVNAYSMDPTRCVTTPALRRSWQHNIDLADYKQRVASDLFAMQGDESLTYKVTMPMTDAGGGIGYQDNVASGGRLATAFISISATPCDFDVTKIPYQTSPAKQCYQTYGAGGNILWTNYTQPTADYLYCHLAKGQTYYVNIRFVDGINPNATTCVGGVCGGGLTFN